MVSRVFCCVYVVPLAGAGVFSDHLHTIGNEDVEPSCFITDIGQDNLGVSPEQFCMDRHLKLVSQYYT